MAWLVAILSIGAGGFFTFAYGVAFGEERTAKWLSALFVSFFTSVLLTQPIKVGRWAGGWVGMYVCV